MNLTITLPLLFALGIRILINLLNPEHSPTTSDHLLIGLWQGVLLYHSLIYFPDVALVVGFAIVGKLVFDFTRPYEDTVSKCTCTLIGVALGVLVTNVLSQFLEESGLTGGGNASSSKERPSTSANVISPSRDVLEPSSRRLRLVSFGRTNPDRHRSSRHTREPEPRSRHRDRDHHDHDTALRDVVSPAPTHAYSIDTQPSISLESCPSSIDPHGLMSPAERQVAILRARASLADSERRRFKEERKWAISQGNKARANQLAWQVKRFAALMESYHREADAKVVEAARAAASGPSVPFPASSAGPSASATRPSGTSSSRRVVSQPLASTSQVQSTTSQRVSRKVYPNYATAGPSSSPLVSVTVGTTGTTTTTRTRKRSGGAGSGLRPAIHVHPGAAKEFISPKR